MIERGKERRVRERFLHGRRADGTGPWQVRSGTDRRGRRKGERIQWRGSNISAVRAIRRFGGHEGGSSSRAIYDALVIDGP